MISRADSQCRLVVVDYAEYYAARRLECSTVARVGVINIVLRTW